MQPAASRVSARGGHEHSGKMTRLCSLSPPCIAFTRQEWPGWRGRGVRGRAVPAAAGRWWTNYTLGQEFSPRCIIWTISKPFVWAKLAAGDVYRLGLAEKMYFLTGRRSPGQRPLQCAAVGSGFPGSRSMWSQGITQALGLERQPRKCSSNWPTSPVL